MKKNVKKSLSVLLAVLMLLSCTCIAAFAEEADYTCKEAVCVPFGSSDTKRAFKWTTDTACDGCVQIVLKDDFDGSFEGKNVITATEKETAAHKIIVEDLELGATYCFRVGSSSKNVWSEVFEFTNDPGFEPLRITCTMNGDAKTQRGFTWFTEKDCDTVLQLIKASDYDGSFDGADVIKGTSKGFKGYFSHKVTASGLEAGTEYYYRVGSAAQEAWSNRGSFVTDDGDDKFSFLAIADIQPGTRHDDEDTEVYFERCKKNYYDSASAVKKGLELYPDSEFIVNLGDFVNECTNDEWNGFGIGFQDVNTNSTLVPVAGNHEGNPTSKQDSADFLNAGWFDNMFNLEAAEGSLKLNGAYYSYDYGNAHFTVLNTNDMYPMTETQRNWAINDLNSSDALFKIVLMHRSAYSAGKNINKPDTIIMRDTIIDIMDRTNVDLVISGHDHMYLRTVPVEDDKACDTVYTTKNGNVYAYNPEGTVYALTGTIGAKRYAVNDNAIKPILDVAEVALSQKDLNGACFSGIEINGNTLTYKAYVVDDDTLEAKVIDEYGIMKTQKSENSGETKLPTSAIDTVDHTIWNFITELFEMIATYIGRLLPQTIIGLF